MPRVAPIVPADSDLLCEGCGYTLNGLSDAGDCPECGKPIVESTGPAVRQRPRWEQEAKPGARLFLRTTAQVLFTPTRFFRSTSTRGSLESARTFALWHGLVAGLLFGAAASVHVTWYLSLGGPVAARGSPMFLLVVGFMCTLLALLSLWGVTELATRLTAWEAAYRGIRLPRDTVLRGMYYHAAHYLPVAGLACATVLGYRWLFTAGHLSIESASTYLYVLSAEVVLSAVYLFQTYWIGMRNMMYANR